MQALRAQVEELQQQNEQLQQSSRKASTWTSTAASTGSKAARSRRRRPPAPPTPAGKPADAGAVRSGQRTARRRSTATTGALAQGADERAAYDAAFDALKAGHYAESAQLFQAFLEPYPNGTYTPNALYWLGESYYVTQNYQLAQEQFQALLDRYPDPRQGPGRAAQGRPVAVSA